MNKLTLNDSFNNKYAIKFNMSQQIIQLDKLLQNSINTKFQQIKPVNDTEAPSMTVSIFVKLILCCLLRHSAFSLVK